MEGGRGAEGGVEREKGRVDVKRMFQIKIFCGINKSDTKVRKILI